MKHATRQQNVAAMLASESADADADPLAHLFNTSQPQHNQVVDAGVPLLAQGEGSWLGACAGGYPNVCRQIGVPPMGSNIVMRSPHEPDHLYAYAHIWPCTKIVYKLLDL